MGQCDNQYPELDPRSLRFGPELEPLYQAHYERNVRPMVRVAAALMAGLFLAYALRDYLDTRSLTLASRANSVPGLGCLLLLALTGVRWAGRHWQSIVVVVALAATWFALSGTAIFFYRHPPPDLSLTAHFAQLPMPPELLFYAQQTCFVMLGFATFRLSFLRTLALEAGIVALSACAYWLWLLDGAPNRAVLLSRFLQPTLVVLCVVALMAYAQEHLARRAFWANHLLDQERNDERRLRERTEADLHLLNRAIGGIVHDLGNPLAAVLTGSRTMELLLDAQPPNTQALGELAHGIAEGGEMLDYLRLSLIEQARVLEGVPTLAERTPASVRRIAETSLRFQKPRYAAQRVTSVHGLELSVEVDGPKLITALMNLVGNALKYSDGEVRVTWRADGDTLRLAVLDQGTAGQGLSAEQAGRLFQPFGRLEQHQRVEGIGLGLLSVRGVAQAHGGEVFIEGAGFTTGDPAAPTMLEPPFHTAFVLALPLPAQPAADPG